MSPQVFYRKWRPQTLAEVVGQEHVTQTIRNALMNGKIAHAYLFCGSRGTGKTSTGRILAKAVNCLNNGSGEPCNACEMCEAISQGRCLDVMEIDAASNRGIDDIRELRERINFAPNVARFKVYIIDEVHMLTDPASNALLKTLEEPPPHAIFILATTETHKLLATILSRCQRFDFRRLSQGAIVSKLNYVCDQEDIHIDDAAVRLIAKGVSGSLRDAENLLEQLVSCCGNELNVHQVEDILGVTTDSRVKQLVRNIVDKDIAAGIGTINSVARDGLPLKQFNQSVVEYLRNMLVAKPGAEEVLDLAQEDLAEVKELSNRMSMNEIVRATRTFGQASSPFDEYSPLPLELALVECSLPAAEVSPLTPTKSASDKVETENAVTFGLATSSSIPPSAVQDAAIAAPAGDPSQEETEKRTDILRTFHSTPDYEYIKTHWNDFARTLKGVGPGGKLAGLLNSSQPTAIEGETLVLRCNNSFVKNALEKPEYRNPAESKLSQTFGKPNKIRLTVATSLREGYLVKEAQRLGATIRE